MSDDQLVHGQVAMFGEDLIHAPRRSADRRRTARQRAQVELGVHPLAGTRLRPDLGTCGDCPMRELRSSGGRVYPKCKLGPDSNGAATDVRAWWPACTRHPDAAAEPS